MADEPQRFEDEDSGAAHAVREEFARLGAGRPWVSRHPALAFSIICTVGGLVWTAAQAYNANAVTEAVTAEQTKAYRNETAAEINGVKDEIESVKEGAKAEHQNLRESIRDVGQMTLQQSKRQEQILEDIAKRQRVKVKAKSPEQKAAEEKVENLP